MTDTYVGIALFAVAILILCRAACGKRDFTSYNKRLNAVLDKSAKRRKGIGLVDYDD